LSSYVYYLKKYVALELENEELDREIEGLMGANTGSKDKNISARKPKVHKKVTTKKKH